MEGFEGVESVADVKATSRRPLRFTTHCSATNRCGPMISSLHSRDISAMNARNQLPSEVGNRGSSSDDCW